MNKNYLTAMLIVFMAVKNPLGFAGVKIVNAQTPNTETNAVSEADIANSILNAYKHEKTKSKEEIANAQLAEYQRVLAEEAAKARAAKNARLATAKQAVKSVPINLQALYQAAEAKYGVSRYILAAVHMVESGQSLDTARSSYAGAQGPMQFMPSTFAAYAQDGDGDGQALINDVHDAVFTAAKYLRANGAASGNVSGALYRYNHSYSYVNHVLSVARSYGFAG
jgi:membrane-bound lytic murein transglycosylase B